MVKEMWSPDQQIHVGGPLLISNLSSLFQVVLFDNSKHKKTDVFRDLVVSNVQATVI